MPSGADNWNGDDFLITTRTRTLEDSHCQDKFHKKYEIFHEIARIFIISLGLDRKESIAESGVSEWF
jgi:hypothetical protein